MADEKTVLPCSGNEVALLELDHVAMSYGEAQILKDVSFALGRGQCISLTSPSGTGKSTILSIAGLLLEPSSGRVLVGGEEVPASNEAKRAALRNRSIGFVFQHTQLVGSLRAWENVAVPARFAKGIDFDVEQRARQLLCDLGLEERLDHYPFQLSVGQKRRIAVARALILNPDIILADEPTNDLDQGSADSVTEILFDQVKQGRGLLLVTHDQELAARADVRLRLEDGKLVQL